jgi:hypothetical protein
VNIQKDIIKVRINFEQAFSKRVNSPYLLGPRALDELGIKDFLPPVKALDVGPARHMLRNLLPMRSSVLCYGVSQKFIL